MSENFCDSDWPHFFLVPFDTRYNPIDFLQKKVLIFFYLLDLYVRKLWHWTPGLLFLVPQYAWKRKIKIKILTLSVGFELRKDATKKCPFTFPGIDNIDTSVCENTTVKGKETKFKLDTRDKIIIVSLVSWEPWPDFFIRSCLHASDLVSQVVLFGESTYQRSLC